MKKLALILLLSAQGSTLAQRLSLREAVADFPRSQLQLKSDGPVSIEFTQGTRAAYQSLAEMAGLNIIFDTDFQEGASGPFRIEAAGILQAFDILAARTGSFVEIVDERTIVAAPDNPANLRRYAVHVLKTFYLPSGTTPQRLTETITMLRTNLQARYLATSSTANAIVMRDTPERIARSEQMIALSARVTGGVPVATRGELIAGNSEMLTLEAGVVKAASPGRPALQPVAAGLVSLHTNESSRTTFETLAGLAGLNIIFDQDFRSQSAVEFKVENVNVLDAIDLLALQTRTFWEFLDGRTIMVIPDNQTKRRQFENTVVKNFYLPQASQRELIEIVTALRTLLNCRYLSIIPGSASIVIRDHPGRVFLAERIVADLRVAGGVTATAEFSTGSESNVNVILNRRAARSLIASPSPLKTPVQGPFSFDLNEGVRASYEAIAAMAGLRLVFDSRFQDRAAAPFKLDSVDILDALDFLSLQTHHIWLPMDAGTILVAPDNPEVRSDLWPRTAKAIDLSRIPQTGIIEIVTALRAVIQVRNVSPLERSIVMDDSPETIAFAERFLAGL